MVAPDSLERQIAGAAANVSRTAENVTVLGITWETSKNTCCKTYIFLFFVAIYILYIYINIHIYIYIIYYIHAHMDINSMVQHDADWLSLWRSLDLHAGLLETRTSPHHGFAPHYGLCRITDLSNLASAIVLIFLAMLPGRWCLKSRVRAVFTMRFASETKKGKVVATVANR